ncbi:hypothetical protein [Micromonospora echinofusca]|uniref:GATA-type domain-containing protein n=1 Tax=Micromonospora echinofusca TaxID=47858 RepID=A0ABS3VL94_MICEH|nr:hypothetical protein [Micromonospora echinofusca]MBO4205287.1 hypothetical protein [Micromonospora echinofusca]
MIRTVVCVEILCDACGDGWTGDDTGPRHFDSPAAARAGVVWEHGWTATTAGTVCADCATLAACQQAGGHHWPSGEEFCTRCGHPDYGHQVDPNADRIAAALRILTAA